MKRLFFILLSLIAVSSCLDDGSGGMSSYTLVAGFQYGDIEFRSDSTCFNTTAKQGYGYDCLNFYHKLGSNDAKVDGGFTLSCLQMPLSGKTEGLNNTYRCYLKGLKEQFSNIYSVFYQNPDEYWMPEHDVKFAYKADGTCTMQGCYVANTVEVVESIKANFKVGDRLTLKATGYLNGAKTGSAEIHLADFSAAKDSIVSLWTPFDLQKLGSVEYVDFEIESTNPAVPAYFCLDNFTTTIEINY